MNKKNSNIKDEVSIESIILGKNNLNSKDQFKNDKFDLEEKITSQIFQYIAEASEYRIRPSVQFGRTDLGSDYALVDIFIDEIKSVGILVK